MKKIFAIGSILLILCLMAYCKNHGQQTYGLAATYDSIQELVDHSQYVIIGQVGSPVRDSMKIGETTFPGNSYIVRVDKILYQKFDIPLDSTIKLEVVDFDQINESIKAGEYLLFLNQLSYEDERVYVNNTPNQLYRYTWWNLLQAFKSRAYRNVRDQTLPWLYMDQVLDIIVEQEDSN